MLSKRMYFTIILLFVSMFIMFILTTYSIENSGDIMDLQDKDISIKYEDIIFEQDLDMDFNPIVTSEKTTVAIITSEKNQEDYGTKNLKEFCIYNKYPFKVFNSLPEANEIYNFDLILFGDIDFELDMRNLKGYSLFGITMIFSKLPDYNTIISQRDLANFLGIKSGIDREIETDGIKIFSEFMIGSQRNYEKDDYFGEEDDANIKVPYYSLLPGYEVYSVGILDNQKELGIKDQNLPPLLWKTKTNNSFVFVVNGEIFRQSSLLGILTGFKSKEKGFHIYPIVNGQTISVVNFPYLSSEREKEMREIYGRSSKVLMRDLLFPNIIQILKNYGDSSNFFFASQLNYNNKEVMDEDLEFYINETNKLSGNIGVSLSQKSSRSIEAVINSNEIYFDKNIPGYKFRNFYLGDFSEEDLRKVTDRDFFDKFSLLCTDYKREEYLLSYFTKDVLSIKYNLNGYNHETIDDMRMLSIENALGMCNLMVDLSPVFYQEETGQQWNDLSIAWSKGKTYFRDFEAFDFLPLNVLEKRVRRFLSLDYNYKYKEDYLELNIDNFDQEAFFILSIYEKGIESTENADIKKIDENTYLIRAKDEKVRITFRELAALDPPTNNKLIPIKKTF